MTELVTPRRSWDWYPTPPEATAVLRDWLIAHGVDAPGHWLDPAAGNGAIVEAVRDCDAYGEGHWSAIEIDEAHADALENVAEDVTIADALSVDWPAAHVVANPPFSGLDSFWPRIVEHRDRHRVWCACLTPCAWWHAEKRAGYARPDHFLALGWRPAFHKKAGPAHKGSQDFSWSILAPFPTGATVWERAEKPSLTQRGAP